MKPPTVFHYTAVLGMAVWAAAMFVVTGFVLQRPRMQNWIGDTPMAVETALCFIACGVSIFVLSVAHIRKHC